MSEQKRGVLILAILGFIVWASMAPLLLFFGVYLRSLEISYSTIGLISTIGAFLSSIPQLVLGAVADKIGRRKQIIIFSMLIRTTASLMMLVSNDAVSISVWYIVANFSLAGFMPIAQSMVADMAEKENVGSLMGSYRLFGSAGWAASCVLTGLLAGGSLRNIFPIVLCFSLLALIFSLALKEPEEKRGGIVNVGHTGKNSPLMLTLGFTASILLSSISMGATSSFLTIFLTQVSMEPLLTGIIIAAGALMEIPAMYLAGRLCDRVGSIAVLSAGEIGLAAVYWLYGTVSSVYTYIIVQGIRGVLYALFTIAGMTVSSSLGGRGRGGLYASLYNLSLNIGMSFGPGFGGMVSDSLGLLANFSISSTVSLVSAAILSPWTLLRRIKKP